MTKDKYIIKELNAKIKIRDHYRNVSIQQNYDADVEYDSGYICGLEFAIHLIEDCKLPYVDENAETLEDKLRDEHRPVPEEREDAIKFHTFKEMVEDDRPTPKGEEEDHSSLFETMAEKFRPKV